MCDALLSLRNLHVSNQHVALIRLYDRDRKLADNKGLPRDVSCLIICFRKAIYLLLSFSDKANPKMPTEYSCLCMVCKSHTGWLDRWQRGASREMLLAVIEYLFSQRQYSWDVLDYLLLPWGLSGFYRAYQLIIKGTGFTLFSLRGVPVNLVQGYP